MDKKSGIYSAQAEFHPIDNITWIARTQNEDKPGKQREAIVTFGDMIYKNLINGNYVFLSSVKLTGSRKEWCKQKGNLKLQVMLELLFES
ncbi:hypothetical protein [Paenibacillus whitsoniae]|uniref:Uncharacterized protein n=1 Tax=Paenibacillus whitsoniae TaxID=2496558 RepID=A0A3S0A7Q5_9BACL|nr:hypothetical protein [Paenibacillus whitsoniae]RTE04304.1 hypothetical protein EJQ19_26705 [Paenibacillus whitsoniae]